MEPEKIRKWIRIGIIAALIAVAVFIYSLRDVLWPFIFAFFIAYIFNPWIDWLERKRFSRTFAILMVMIGFALVLIVGAILIFPSISHEIVLAREKLPRWIQVIRVKAGPWVQDLTMRHPEIASQIEEYANNNLRQKLPLLLSPVFHFLKSMFSGVLNFFIMLLNLVLVPVLAFYLMKDFQGVEERFFELIPPRYLDGFKRRLGEVDTALSSYIRGQLTVSLVLAMIYTIGLLILGVPLAIPIGLFSGLANMVPYLGFVLGISTSMILSFLDNQQWQRLVGILIVYSVAQLLEGVWIGPHFTGKSTGLHPLVVMLSLVIGGTLFGFMGMVLAVPFVAVGSVFSKAAYEAYLNSQFYSQHRQKKAEPVI